MSRYAHICSSFNQRWIYFPVWIEFVVTCELPRSAPFNSILSLVKSGHGSHLVVRLVMAIYGGAVGQPTSSQNGMLLKRASADEGHPCTIEFNITAT